MITVSEAFERKVDELIDGFLGIFTYSLKGENRKASSRPLQDIIYSSDWYMDDEGSRWYFRAEGYEGSDYQEKTESVIQPGVQESIDAMMVGMGRAAGNWQGAKDYKSYSKSLAIALIAYKGNKVVMTQRHVNSFDIEITVKVSEDGLEGEEIKNIVFILPVSFLRGDGHLLVSRVLSGLEDILDAKSIELLDMRLVGATLDISSVRWKTFDDYCRWNKLPFYFPRITSYKVDKEVISTSLRSYKRIESSDPFYVQVARFLLVLRMTGFSERVDEKILQFIENKEKDKEDIEFLKAVEQYLHGDTLDFERESYMNKFKGVNKAGWQKWPGLQISNEDLHNPKTVSKVLETIHNRHSLHPEDYDFLQYFVELAGLC